MENELIYFDNNTILSENDSLFLKNETDGDISKIEKENIIETNPFKILLSNLVEYNHYQILIINEEEEEFLGILHQFEYNKILSKARLLENGKIAIFFSSIKNNEVISLKLNNQKFNLESKSENYFETENTFDKQELNDCKLEFESKGLFFEHCYLCTTNNKMEKLDYMSDEENEIIDDEIIDDEENQKMSFKAKSHNDNVNVNVSNNSTRPTRKNLTSVYSIIFIIIIILVILALLGFLFV